MSSKIVVDALNLSHGGGVVVMRRIVNALTQRGHEVTVIAARPKVVENLEGHLIKSLLYPKASGAVSAILFRWLRLKSKLNSSDYDGLISFNFFTPTNLKQVTYHINLIPHLPFKERSVLVGRLKSFMQARSARLALKRSKANAFESNFIKSLASQNSNLKGTEFVAYTGIEIPKVAGPRTQPKHKSIVVLITSGAKHKRNDVAIRAFKAFAESLDSAKLQIFGNTDQIRNRLPDSLIEYCDTSGKVEFCGYVDRESIYQTLSKSFALITASELESFYMVALEAMIVGCPVVAADISSVNESTGDAGMLFPPSDWERASLKLKDLQDPKCWAETSKEGFEWAKKFEAEQLAQEFAERIEIEFGIDAK